MLHIQNIRKLGGRRLFGGWIITAVGGNPNEPQYLIDIHCNETNKETIVPIDVIEDKDEFLRFLIDELI